MMKWWGWGDSDKSFPMNEKANLWPFIQRKLGLKLQEKTHLPIDRLSIRLPFPNIEESFVLALSKILRSDQISSHDDDRLVHSYGKSYADLFCVRKGVIKRAPDLIVYPENHDEVEKIVKLAHLENVCLVPFGGGTNIVGGVDPRDAINENGRQRRSIITINMMRMNKLISLDKISHTAVIQAGILGPKLEEDLEQEGWALGHFPDSFEFSTLGGWVATRSAGMQSDAYGKIEDMIVSIKMVSPTGTIETRTVPASSAGPDFNRLISGSEGVLGVITEVTVRIHKTPLVKDYRGFLFPSFKKGIEAIRECLNSNWLPSMIRLQDEGETELAFNLKKPKQGLEGFIQKQLKTFLKMTGYHRPCVLIVGFEGDVRQTKLIADEAIKIFKKHKAFKLGKNVGLTWYKDKFNVPYLRDFVMDYGIMVDVAETAATWSKLFNVYEKSIEAIQAKFKTENNGNGYIGCHISHTYQTGACLYFTYAAPQKAGQELEQYYSYKKSITDIFIINYATLSHHHSIGYEHSSWLSKEISPAALQTLQAIKSNLDPKNILNPGKLLPVSEEIKHGLFGIEAPDQLDLIIKNQQKITKYSQKKVGIECNN